MRIADTFNGKCFERGISTMRLALGYTQALPSFWPCHSPIKDYETLDLVCIAFPRHEIRIWHSDRGCYEGARCEHWEYMGNSYITTEDANDWLTAFGYGNEENTCAHFVVGEPVVYGPSHKLLYAVAVSLKENTP